MGEAERMKLFGREVEVSKEERYGWRTLDKPGVFMEIPKQQLRIDPSYQRDETSELRIRTIREGFRWSSFGCLLVAQRPDLSLWVYDGQHRTLAVMKMASISHVPCMVYQCDTVEDEADNFLSANTVRGMVAVFHKFRAAIRSGHPLEVAVKEMVERSGYHITRNGSGAKSVSCVGHLLKEYAARPDICRRVWNFSVELYAGAPVIGEVFSSLCAFEDYMTKRKFGSIADAKIREKLLVSGKNSIIGHIRDAHREFHKSGPHVGSAGIVALLNAGRRKGTPKILCPMAATRPEGGTSDE